MTAREMPTRIREWTVEEYHRMIETGILAADDRVELLEGQILEMSPQLPPHAATTQRASDYLATLLAGRALVRRQLPVTLKPRSEPEPDLAIVRLDPRDYVEAHPTPADIFWLIEVADPTLAKDRKQKAIAYARAKIADYWILAVNRRQIYVFRQPGARTYSQELILEVDALAEAGNATLSPLAFPDLAIDLTRLFPKQIGA